MLDFLTGTQHKCILEEKLMIWTVEMSCEGLGNAVPETAERVVKDVLLHGFCPFDITLLSSSTFVDLSGIKICTAEILSCPGVVVLNSYSKCNFFPNPVVFIR